MTSIAKFLGIALFASSAVYVHAQAANVDFDHSVNFYKFRSFSLEKVHATDPLVEQRILVALERDLKGAPMQSDAAHGDLIVTACEAATDATEYSTFYSGLGTLTPARGWATSGFLDTTATVDAVPSGTLIVDMYDRKTQKLVWRGMISEPTAGSTDKNDRRMDKAVNTLLAKFPPKPIKGAK